MVVGTLLGVLRTISLVDHSPQVSNQDHVSNVMKKIFSKFNIDANPEDFYLCQRLENSRGDDCDDEGSRKMKVPAVAMMALHHHHDGNDELLNFRFVFFSTEIELPDRGNLFYAIKTSNEVRLVVRTKGEGRSKNKSKSRGVSALPGSRGKQDPNGGRLTRIFNSMVSLVPS